MKNAIGLMMVSLGATAVACAHTETKPTCPPCERNDDQQAEMAELEKTVERLQKQEANRNQEMAKQEQNFGFMSRWQESFTQIVGMIDTALTPEDDVESDEEADDTSKLPDSLDGLTYKTEYVNGSLELSFSNDIYFNRGKAGLTKQGKAVLSALAEVFQNTENRRVMIGCRSTADQEKMTHAKWLIVRELSAKRAVAIMAELEKDGVEPRNLVAASLSNKVEEDSMERGTTVFVISPSPREMPKYPSKP